MKDRDGVQSRRSKKEKRGGRSERFCYFSGASTPRVFQDGGNTSVSPSLSTHSLIHSLFQHSSPAVDWTWLFQIPLSYFHVGSFLFPVMFIHDQGSEREIRSQVLSWPRGLWGLQVMLLRVQAHENTKTHICQYGFVSRSNWDILWVKLPKRYQTAIEPAPSLCCFCLSGRDFFFRDVSTETGLTLICQQCLSWCHDRHTHTTWEAEFLFHPPSFLHIVVYVACFLLCAYV